MLQIIKPVNGSRKFRRHDNVMGIGMLGTSVAITFLTPSDGKSDRVERWRDSIVDSPPSHFGNRDCSHVAIEGTIVGGWSSFSPFTATCQTHTSTTPRISYPERRLRDPISTGSWTNVVYYGGSGSMTRTYPDFCQYHTRFYTNVKVTYSWGSLTSSIVYEYDYKNGLKPVVHQRASSHYQYSADGLQRRFSSNGTTWGAWSPTSEVSYTILDDGDFDVSGLRRFFDRNLGILFPSHGEAGNLARIAADDARYYDVNTLEYIRDLPMFLKELPQLSKTLRRPSPRSVAKLYLSYKYGSRLTAADSEEILDGISYEFKTLAESRLYDKARAMSVRNGDLSSLGYSATPCSCRRNLSIYYNKRDDLTTKIVTSLQSMRLTPSLRTTWELIPFSFCLDWFYDVSSRLESIDANDIWLWRAILECVHTEKYEVPNFDISNYSAKYSGDVSYKKYRRHVHHSLPENPTYVDSVSSFSNYAEATALIFSRRR